MKKKKVIVPNIVRGGAAVPLGNNMYLLKGRSHEQGGIDIGADPKTGLEAEGGEIIWMGDSNDKMSVINDPNNNYRAGGKNSKMEIKVFSSVPFLNGKSPVDKVLEGEDPNKVFAQQETYKDRNNINDDGTKKNKMGYGGNHPLNTKYKQKQVIDMKDNDSRRKAKAGLRYILQTNGNSRLGYVPSTGESLSEANGRTKAELGTGYTINYGKIKSFPTDTLRYQYVTNNPEYKKQFSDWISKIDGMSSEELKAERDKLRKLVEPTLDNSIVDGNPNARLIFGNVKTYDNSDQAIYNLYSHKASLNDRLGYLNARINRVPGAKGYKISTPINRTNGTITPINRTNRTLPNFSFTEMTGLPKASDINLQRSIPNIGINTDNINDPLQRPNFKVEDSKLPTIIEEVGSAPKTYSPNVPMPMTKINVPVFNISNSSSSTPEVKPINIKQDTQSFLDKAKNLISENPNTASEIASSAANIIGAITSYNANKRMLNNLNYNRKPIPRIAAKLKTNININPQLDKMRESLANYERNIDTNTASSQVGLARKQKARANSLSGYNELYGYKENAETELINKDRLNQQEVANQSIADYNSYIEKKMAFDNAVREKKAENVVSLVNNLASIPSDIISRTDKRRSDVLNAALIMARNPNVTPEYLESLGIKLPGNKRKNNKKD